MHHSSQSLERLCIAIWAYVHNIFIFFPKQKKLLIHIILVKQKITLDVHKMQQKWYIPN